MSKKRRTSFCLLLGLLLSALFLSGLFLFPARCSHTDDASEHLDDLSAVSRDVGIISAESISQLDNGDLICRRGIGNLSGTFARACKVDKRFSHVGIVVYIDNVCSVIHSCTNGVEISSVEEFIRNSTNDWAVFRFNLPREQRYDIPERAKRYLGRKFDKTFNFNSTDQLCCTQLVYECVKEATGSEYIKKRMWWGKYIVTPDDCYAPTEAIRILDSRDVN